jgi:hypothetical protein
MMTTSLVELLKIFTGGDVRRRHVTLPFGVRLRTFAWKHMAGADVARHVGVFRYADVQEILFTKSVILPKLRFDEAGRRRCR